MTDRDDEQRDELRRYEEPRTGRGGLVLIVRGIFGVVCDALPDNDALAPTDALSSVGAMQEPFAAQRHGETDERIARATQAMRDGPGQTFTVTSLAKIAGLSRAAFARRFLAEHGVPPLRFLTDLRMRRAADLLRDDAASIAGIGAAVGYDSEFAFSRAFKRFAGQAPGVFRKRARDVGSFGTPPTRAAA